MALSTAAADGVVRHALLPALADLPGHLAWLAAARVNTALDRALPDGFDIHSYAALLALAGGHARSQQAVADTVSVSRTTMVKVAAELAAQGLVDRVRSPADRRSYVLTRTPSGAATAERWRRHAEQLEDSITAGFTALEREKLRSLLLRVVEPDLPAGTPDALRESTAFLLTRFYYRLHRDLATALRPVGIEPRHFRVLVALRATGPVSQGVLARHLGVSGAGMVKVVGELEARGMVERRRLASDRRTQLVHPLPAADAIVESAAPLAAAAARRRLAPLGPRDRKRLVSLLARFVTAP